MMYMKYEHLLIFGSVMVVAWFLFIYFWPRLLAVRVQEGDPR